jgi:fused signal recognition particle receptor
MGKTTTIGKIASRLKNELNMTVLLGACDTFRAAAVEQLSEWAIRANVSIEKPFDIERGGDPVPVVSRTIHRAKDEGYDVVIIDTSGRLSNNFELTMQLQSMKQAIEKEIPSAPHETLVLSYILAYILNIISHTSIN